VTDPTLVMPITHEDVSTLIASPTPSDWFGTAPASKVASVMLLQQLPSLIKKHDRADKLLHKAMSDILAGTTTPADLKYLRDAVSASFSASALQKALGVLMGSGVRLSTSSDFRIAQPTRADGSWSTGFSSEVLAQQSPDTFSPPTLVAYEHGLNDGQGRVVSKIIMEDDEHLHVQGYPGSGKSHLIQTLTTVLKPKETIVIAQTRAQLDGLFSKISSPEVTGRTFGHLAAELLNAMDIPAHWRPGKRSTQSYNISDGDIASRLEFRAVANLAPAVVASTCRRSVMSYCATDADYIGPEHLPKICDRLGMPHKAVLIEYAQLLWEETVEPKRGAAFLPVRTYHQIKHASILGGHISEPFKHVIVDESHDLTPAMLKLLDLSPVQVITFGDKFQRLSGRAPSRGTGIRTNELDLTMRAGREMENVINPIIEAHPMAHNETPLRATDRVTTICDYYDRPTIPDTPCTILVGGLWHLLEYFQRLSYENVKFAMLPGSAAQFQAFTEGLMDLYHRGIRSSHSSLFRYPDWSSLQGEAENIRAFQRVHTMLEKGYDRQRFADSLKNIVPIAKARYVLGRVEDARNLEFQSVMLTPELLPSKKTANSQYYANALSQLYMGASRARNRLIVPGYMRDALKDQKKST